MECLYGHRLADADDLMSFHLGPDLAHLAWKPENEDMLKKTLSFKGTGAEIFLLCSGVSG